MEDGGLTGSRRPARTRGARARGREQERGHERGREGRGHGARRARLAEAALAAVAGGPTAVLDADGRVVEAFGRPGVAGGGSAPELGRVLSPERIRALVPLLREVIAEGMLRRVEGPRPDPAAPPAAPDGGPYDLVLAPVHEEGRTLVAVTVTAAPKGSRPDEGVSHDEILLRAFTLHSHDIVAAHDERLRFTYVSPSCSLLGFEPSDLLGTDPLERVHPEDRARVEQVLADADRHGFFRLDALRFRDAAGGWRWLETRGWGPPTKGGSLTVSRDVTEKVDALRRLERSEARYRFLAENTLDMIGELDAQGRIVFASPNHATHLGYAPEELLGREVSSLVHPDDVDWAMPALERMLRDRPPGVVVVRMRHADGSWRYVQTSARAVEIEPGVTRVVAVSRDVTSDLRAVAERQKLERRLQETEHGRTLTRLAGDVAHDLNNLMLATLGLSDLVHDGLPDGSPLRAHVEEIVSATAQAAQLSDALLAYSGRGSGRFETVDLNDVVREMRLLLATGVCRGARLETDLSAAPATVCGDPVQLRQLVCHLVTNAVEALDGADGTVQVQVTSPATRAGDPPAPRDLVLLEVRDNGSGMDEETREKVFQPFYTTKSGRRGLGLSAVEGIVRRHGGTIEVRSAPGRGTRVRVALPLHANESGPGEEPEPHDDAPRLLVLLVDDEPLVRTVATAMLVGSGFEVIKAPDGASAVAELEAHPEIDCAIVDLTMPAMDGWETLEALRRLRPDLPVLLSSGYPDPGEGSQPRGVAFLRKPYRLDELRRAVRRTLASKD